MTKKQSNSKNSLSKQSYRASYIRTFDKHLNDLLNIALARNLSEENAEDLVQNAFESLERKIDLGKWTCVCIGPECNCDRMFRYLSKIVSRRAKGHFQSIDERKSINTALELESLQPSNDQIIHDNPEEICEKIELVTIENEVLAILIDLIEKKLSPNHQEVLIQKFFSAETLDQFAKRLNLTKSNIYVLRKRAIDKLSDIVFGYLIVDLDSDLENPENEKKNAKIRDTLERYFELTNREL